MMDIKIIEKKSVLITFMNKKQQIQEKSVEPVVLLYVLFL